MHELSDQKKVRTYRFSVSRKISISKQIRKMAQVNT
jgi:hypothetical protein